MVPRSVNSHPPRLGAILGGAVTCSAVGLVIMSLSLLETQTPLLLSVVAAFTAMVAATICLAGHLSQNLRLNPMKIKTSREQFLAAETKRSEWPE